MTTYAQQHRQVLRRPVESGLYAAALDPDEAELHLALAGEPLPAKSH